MPSGVMANQIAVRVLTRPGDVVVAGRDQHVVEFRDGRRRRGTPRSSSPWSTTAPASAHGDVLEVIDAEHDHQPHVAHGRDGEHPHGRGRHALGTSSDVRRSAIASATGRSTLTARDCSTPSVATGTSAADYCDTGDHGHGVSLQGSLRAGGFAARGTERPDDASADRTQAPRRHDASGRLPRRGGSRGARHHGRSARRRPRAGAALSPRSSRATFPESDYDPASCRTNIVAFDHPQARQIVASSPSGACSGERSRRDGSASSPTPASVTTTWPSWPTR